MDALKQRQIWLVAGSQHLYGPEAIEQVRADAREVAQGLNDSPELATPLRFKAVVTTSEDVLAVCREANADDRCAGVVAWMHTFSPAKMWIAGLRELVKPLAHLHTQYARDLPWSTIDMDYMNLHQSAHGGREFGYICARLRKSRKVIVGHWRDPRVAAKLGAWSRAAAGLADSRGGRIARFGDNMRNVAVTEGDKVAAQEVFGYRVDGYGVGDLVECVDSVAAAEVDALLGDYAEQYDLPEPLQPGGARRADLAEAGRIELGLRAFLTDGGFTGFTTTFENLHGLAQLPGLAVQRLMAEGFGFAAEGDWKTAALVRAMKVMGAGLDGGTSFMEDYTYHLDPAGPAVLGAHMLEVCPTIADGTPTLAVHPLGIGGKDDPARLIFDARPGPAVNAALIDLGERFRLVVNPVEVIAPPHDLPNLPVARALWRPQPDLETSAAGWIYAGGAHHFGFSQAATVESLEDFAEMVGVELALIDAATDLRRFRQQLRLSDASWRR